MNSLELPGRVDSQTGNGITATFVNDRTATSASLSGPVPSVVLSTPTAVVAPAPAGTQAPAVRGTALPYAADWTRDMDGWVGSDTWNHVNGKLVNSGKG